MKNNFSFIVIWFLLILSVSAQDVAFNDDVPRTKMRPADHIIISLFTDVWSGLPENMDTYYINRGIAFDYLQELPLGTSNFSIAAGLGLSNHNLYSDHKYSWDGDNYNFTEIPTDLDYKNNKLSLSYINIPLEFRFRTRNLPKTFRIHAGIKGGYLISAHTKYYGDDDMQAREIKIKEKSLDNIEPFLLGLNGRIGYGRVNVSAFMSLSGLFRENNAQNAEFISLGLTAIIF